MIHNVLLMLAGVLAGVVLAIPVIVIANLIIFRIYIRKLNEEDK